MSGLLTLCLAGCLSQFTQFTNTLDVSRFGFSMVFLEATLPHVHKSLIAVFFPVKLCRS